MLQAVIFDFDGVIADTEKLHLRAFQEVLGEHGVGLTTGEYFSRYVGLDDAGLFRTLARDRDLAIGETKLAALLADKVARYGRLIASTPVIFDGVEQRVREWSAVLRLAIASGALRREVEAILARHHLLACFHAIVTSEDVTRGKPAPDPYLAALERLNAVRPKGEPAIEAGDVVVIEDAPTGVESARAAGMRTVAVTTNCSAEQLGKADLIVSSLQAVRLDTLQAVYRRP